MNEGTDFQIVTAGRISKSLKKYKFTLSSSVDGAYLLKINNVSKDDAGTYTCIEKTGFGEAESAELIVFGNSNLNNYKIYIF